jgi:hypothetical protein
MMAGVGARRTAVAGRSGGGERRWMGRGAAGHQWKPHGGGGWTGARSEKSDIGEVLRAEEGSRRRLASVASHGTVMGLEVDTLGNDGGA